ncbi:MAG: HNH endonuclease signature motif containing protein, partial [Halarcobacter sp.]
IKYCQVCGLKFKRWTEPDLEHVLPLSLGGEDNYLNWQLLCKRCNKDKSSLFGIASVNRAFILSDSKVFKYSSGQEQIKKIPKNYRYLVMERDKRKCTLCANDHTNKQLYVTIQNKDEIVHYDNLYTICDVCLRAKNIPKTETL